MTRERAVTIPPVGLDADLVVPGESRGIVVFAHGTGSSRHSTRNRFVASQLQAVGIATLLLDLLTEEEEQVDVRTRHLRFDIGMLAARLVDTLDWLRSETELQDLPAGFFGASTGAGAALVASVDRPGRVRAIVSRGGRPDLAGDVLPQVEAPTLLIVGSEDRPVIALNESAQRQLRCENRLDIVSGATHLFEEPGAIEQVAQLARDWFTRYLHR